MGMTSGLLVAMILAAGPGRTNEAEVRYDVSIMEMKGLGWRSALYSQLQPEGRQDGGSVWLAGPGMADEVGKLAESVQASPRMTAYAGATARIESMNVRCVVGGLIRHGDGPYQHSRQVAYTPEVDRLREGFEATLVGYPTTEGVRTRLAIADTRITAIHTGTIQETPVGPGPDGKPAACLAVQFQVPEVRTARMEGEWVVPKNGCLVVSLGVSSGIDAKGQSVVCERLALIEPKAVAGYVEVETLKANFAAGRNAQAGMAPIRTDGDVMATIAPPTPVAVSSLPWSPAPELPPLPEPPAAKARNEVRISGAIPISMPLLHLALMPLQMAVEVRAGSAEMPALPSRTMPVALNSRGMVESLPALPAEDDAITDPSAEPRPAPQARPYAMSPATPTPSASPTPMVLASEEVECEESILFPVCVRAALIDPAPARELSLGEAIAMGREVAKTHTKISPTDRAAQDRSIAQTYWALALGNAQLRTRAAVVDRCRTLETEIRGNKESDQTNHALAQVARTAAAWRADRAATEQAIAKIESNLRPMLGMAADDGRKIVPTTPPRSDQVLPDRERTVAEMIIQVATSGSAPAMPETAARLTRAAHVVEQQFHQSQGALQIRDSSRRAMEQQSTLYREGRLAIGSLTTTIDRWAADSLAADEDLCKYNTAIASLHECQANLLASQSIAAAPEAPDLPRKPSSADGETIRTGFDGEKDADLPPSGALTPTPRVGINDAAGSLNFRLLGPEGTCRYDGEMTLDALQDAPITLRVPTSGGGVVEIQATLIKKPASARKPNRR